MQISLKNISQIKPGWYLDISLNNLAISEKQWFYPLKNLFSIHPDYETNKLELKQKLHDAVKLRLDADLKIGTSFTIFSVLGKLIF